MFEAPTSESPLNGVAECRKEAVHAQRSCPSYPGVTLALHLAAEMLFVLYPLLSRNVKSTHPQGSSQDVIKSIVCTASPGTLLSKAAGLCAVSGEEHRVAVGFGCHCLGR